MKICDTAVVLELCSVVVFVNNYYTACTVRGKRHKTVECPSVCPSVCPVDSQQQFLYGINVVIHGQIFIECDAKNFYMVSYWDPRAIDVNSGKI